jgi:hypothetical protein
VERSDKNILNVPIENDMEEEKLTFQKGKGEILR